MIAFRLPGILNTDQQSVISSAASCLLLPLLPRLFGSPSQETRITCRRYLPLHRHRSFPLSFLVLAPSWKVQAVAPSLAMGTQFTLLQKATRCLVAIALSKSVTQILSLRKLALADMASLISKIKGLLCDVVA